MAAANLAITTPQRKFTGGIYWAPGHFVSSVHRTENSVRAYIRNQEEKDERYDHVNLRL
jgi:REP element-mobilizing transposase RayT